MAHDHGHGAARGALVLGALGIVYGDIGTSPLYALKETFTEESHELTVDAVNVYGVCSLAFWSLLVIISLKYVAFVMRADNKGEGGILALTSLVMKRHNHVAKAGVLVGLGVFGTALLYGDGIITPAISVLSAVEGLERVSPSFDGWVVPIAVVILLGLFVVQKRGTGAVGKVFGPIMVVWFFVIAVLGIRQIVNEPGIFRSMWPGYAVDFFRYESGKAFLSLGSIFLVVTGGEALYADMGHFGRRPIMIGWYSLVLPALLLNYWGQGALLLQRPEEIESAFFAMAPQSLALPLTLLATMATIIASQALISGAFSLTRQAMLLGFLPRVTIRHTAAESEGQIYIPEVNVLLGVGCLALVLTFRESVKLAAAYGLAVSGTMVVTTILYYLVIRHTWGWGRLPSLAVLVLFLSFDIPFLIANLFKFFDGGYIPMLIGAGLIAAMLIWSRGRTAVIQRYSSQFGPFETEWPRLAPRVAARVPGTGVFLATSRDHLPPVLVHQIDRTGTLHETVVMLTVADEPVPEVPDGERTTVERLGDGFVRISLRFGYMEQPLLLPCLRQVVAAEQLPIDLDTATFFIGHATVVADHAGQLSFIPEAIFAYLKRNAVREEQRYGLPADQVMEIGEQISI